MGGKINKKLNDNWCDEQAAKNEENVLTAHSLQTSTSFSTLYLTLYPPCMQIWHPTLHTRQPIQFTSIKYIFFIILGGYGHIEKWIQENITFTRFCSFGAKRLKQCRTSSRHMPSPNAHWLAKCNRLRNLVGSEIWSRTHVLCTTLLLPSTAMHARWNSKCRCHQRKNKRPWPA